MSFLITLMSVFLFMCSQVNGMSLMQSWPFSEVGDSGSMQQSQGWRLSKLGEICDSGSMLLPGGWRLSKLGEICDSGSMLLPGGWPHGEVCSPRFIIHSPVNGIWFSARACTPCPIISPPVNGILPLGRTCSPPPLTTQSWLLGEFCRLRSVQHPETLNKRLVLHSSQNWFFIDTYNGHLTPPPLQDWVISGGSATRHTNASRYGGFELHICKKIGVALNETAKKVSEGLHSSVSCGRIASSEDDFMEKYGSASSSNMDNTSGSTSFFYPAAAFIYDGNIRDFYKWIAKIAIWKNAFYNPHNRILSVPLMRKGLYGNVPLQVIARHSDVGIHIYNAEEIRFKMDEDGVVTMFPSLWSPYYDKWLIILNHLEIKDNQWYTSIQE